MAGYNWWQEAERSLAETKDAAKHRTALLHISYLAHSDNNAGLWVGTGERLHQENGTTAKRKYWKKKKKT